MTCALRFVPAPALPVDNKLTLIGVPGVADHGLSTTKFLYSPGSTGMTELTPAFSYEPDRPGWLSYRDEIGFCSYGDFQPAFRDVKFEKVVTPPFRREI